MVDGISAGGMQGMQMMQGMHKPPSGEEMFSKLSLDAGGDGTSITKDQLQSFINTAKEKGMDTTDFESLLSKFDEVSGGSNSITFESLDAAVQNGTLEKPRGPKPPQGQGQGGPDYSRPFAINTDAPIDFSV